jgi:rhodanese-related sulfurtransferase
VEIFPQELAARLQGPDAPHLLDVRQPEEHEFAALPNSTLIPLGQLAARAAEIASWKKDEIVVYCHHGIRSQHAIHLLAQMGFEKLVNLTGGIDQWSREIDSKVPRY